MKHKFMKPLIGAAIVIIGIISIGWLVQQKPTVTAKSKPSSNAKVISGHGRSAKAGTHSALDQAHETRLTDQDVVGVWVNHHNKDIHQQITFTADHKWKENQHHVTNIYSGTWKIVDHHQISLAPYGETIRLYGNNFNTMNVLNYNHILNKQ